MYHTPRARPKLSPTVLQLLFKVIYEGALRVSEAIKLTDRDIIVEKQLIRLEGTKGTKKSKKKELREFAWVSEKTYSELVEHAAITPGLLFPVTRQTVWRWTKEIGEKVGIELIHKAKDTKNLTVHTLRHFRAIHLLDGGFKVHELMKKLRHRSLEPTTTYTEISNEDVRKREAQIT